MKTELGDELRLHHIISAIEEIETYLHNITFEEFQLNSEKRFATIKQLEIIGEACNHLSDTFKEKNPSIEWLSIRGFRNISIHEYFGISFKLVWQIAQKDIPILKQQFLSANR